MDDRRRRRERAERYVAEGRFRSTGCVRWGTLDHVIDSTFFAALLPDACVILAAMPLRGQPDRWEVKVRLGPAAPAGMTLHDLRIGEWDPAFGGRWIAGANRRAGGTTIPIEAYAAELWRRIAVRHPPAGGGRGTPADHPPPARLLLRTALSTRQTTAPRRDVENPPAAPTTGCRRRIPAPTQPPPGTRSEENGP